MGGEREHANSEEERRGEHETVLFELARDDARDDVHINTEYGKSDE
jgi:hypothetical protein